MTWVTENLRRSITFYFSIFPILKKINYFFDFDEKCEKVRTDLYDDRLDISNNSIYEIGFNDIVILIKSKITASFKLEHNYC